VNWLTNKSCWLMLGAAVSGMRSLAKGASNRSLCLALCDCGWSFHFNSNLHPRAGLEADIATIFVP
jgi:hypothetical protein